MNNPPMSSLVPRMGAEAGYDVQDQPAPIRVTGYVTLLLGLISGFSLVGTVLVIFAILAILMGLIALRPSDRGRPLGTTAAKIGMICAAVFGSCGFFLHWFATETVGREAIYFGRQYLKVVAANEFGMASELRKEPVNRLPTTTSVKQHYAKIRAKTGPQGEPNGEFEEFNSDDINTELRKLPAGTELVSVRRPRLYSSYGQPRVDVYFNTAENSLRSNVTVTLAYVPDPATGVRDWYVTNSRRDAEQPIAQGNY